MKTLKFLVAMSATAALVAAVGCSSTRTDRNVRSTYDSDRVASRDTTVSKSVESTSNGASETASAPSPAYAPPATPAPQASSSTASATDTMTANRSAPVMSEPTPSRPERVAKADRG